MWDWVYLDKSTYNSDKSLRTRITFIRSSEPDTSGKTQECHDNDEYEAGAASRALLSSHTRWRTSISVDFEISLWPWYHEVPVISDSEQYVACGRPSTSGFIWNTNREIVYVWLAHGGNKYQLSSILQDVGVLSTLHIRTPFSAALVKVEVSPRAITPRIVSERFNWSATVSSQHLHHHQGNKFWSSEKLQLWIKDITSKYNHCGNE